MDDRSNAPDGALSVRSAETRRAVDAARFGGASPVDDVPAGASPLADGALSRFVLWWRLCKPDLAAVAADGMRP